MKDLTQENKRWLLQPSEHPEYWVCTDTINRIVCVFENQHFNENQKFTPLEDFDSSKVMKLATFAREMSDWLRSNHYEKIMPK